VRFGEGAVPPPQKFFEFLSRNGAFLCILLMTWAWPPAPLDPPLPIGVIYESTRDTGTRVPPLFGLRGTLPPLFRMKM